MVTFPEGYYNSVSIEKYFKRHLGFTKIPENFIWRISVDKEHLGSFIRRKKIVEGVDKSDAKKIYRQKIKNVIRYAKEHNCVRNVIWGAVMPVGEEKTFESKVRTEFDIPSEFRLDLLRKSIYTPRQEKHDDAVDLRDTMEFPFDVETCYFLAKRQGKLKIYPNIAAFGYDISGVEYEKFVL